MRESIPDTVHASTLVPELRLGLGAWALFIAATCAYCLVHQAFVSGITPDPGRTLTIALREWGLWAMLAPWALRSFRRVAPTTPNVVVRSALFGLAAALLPLTADLITGNRALGASLALFWPRNFAVALLLHFVSRVGRRPATAPPPSQAMATPASVLAEPPAQAETTRTLLVSKGADECLIRVADIEFLSAAGNYIDICARRQRYLIRATMAELEELLPSDEFVRVHRSHIVRVGEIERICIERSGSGTVHLRGGDTLAISKSYRSQLKRHKQDARQTQ